MHIFCKYITDSSLKIPCIGILVKHLYALCIDTQRNFVNQNKNKKQQHTHTEQERGYSSDLEWKVGSPRNLKFIIELSF